MKKYVQSAENDVNKMRENRRNAKARREQKKSDKLESLKNADDIVQKAFDAFVPASGKADTFIGEVARAFMRLLYRDYNDGDVFYEGYGIETCADCVAFLVDVLPDLFDDFEDIAVQQLKDKAYTEALQDTADRTIDYLANHPELALRPNDVDMFDYNGEEFIRATDWEPTYDIDIDIPENLAYHLDKGDISERDAIWEMQSWDYLRDADIQITHWGGVVISDLTYDDYVEVEQNMYRWLEDWGQDLDDEFGYEDDEEDEEYED